MGAEGQGNVKGDSGRVFAAGEVEAGEAGEPYLSGNGFGGKAGEGVLFSA